jgi:transposase
VDGKQLQKQYKNHISDYYYWEQLEHAKDYIIFPENIGDNVAIDETCLFNGDFYTVIINKAAKGKKGSIVAIIRGTDGKTVSEVLLKIKFSKLCSVKTITLDMANSMDWIVRQCFPNSRKIIDRFHVEKLLSEAVQTIRIKYRWEAIDEDNEDRKQAWKDKVSYKAFRYENGKTKKQLLARSRYALFKTANKWTESQTVRIKILFKEYPEIEKAYELAMRLKYIYHNSKSIPQAKLRLEAWHEKVMVSDIHPLITAAETVREHQTTILNYFPDRLTNANAESFNAKLKGFRSLQRGIRDISFFLYRLSKLYA